MHLVLIMVLALPFYRNGWCISSPSYAHDSKAIWIWNQYGFITMATPLLVVKHIVQLLCRFQTWSVDMYHSSCNIFRYCGSNLANKTTLWLCLGYISRYNGHVHHVFLIVLSWKDSIVCKIYLRTSGIH